MVATSMCTNKRTKKVCSIHAIEYNAITWKKKNLKTLQSEEASNTNIHTRTQISFICMHDRQILRDREQIGSCLGLKAAETCLGGNGNVSEHEVSV